MSKGTSAVKRSARDGAISVTWSKDLRKVDAPSDVFIAVETDGKREAITMTEYNARRIVGAMCLMLGLELKPSSAKKIAM